MAIREPKCPCKGCLPIADGGDRYPGCQDHCEKSIEYNRLREIEKKKLYKAELGNKLAGSRCREVCRANRLKLHLKK